MQLIARARHANEIGPQVNTKKTQAMINQNTNNTSIEFNGQDVEWVDNFKYLDLMMLSSNTDIKARKVQA